MKDVNIERVVDVIRRVGGIKIEQDQLNSNLTKLGMDSIRFIQIVVALEEEFDCEIPDSKLLFSELDTVNKIVGILHMLHEGQSG